MQVNEQAWRNKATLHQNEVESLTTEWRQYRDSGQKHPILDFLFSYYNLKISRLRLWSPGPEITLEGEHDGELLFGYYHSNETSFKLDPSRFPLQRLKNFKWISELLKKTSQKTPVFNCYGVHEWCMIYKSESKRHEELPLRISSKVLEDFVENTPCQCTHFDAYRFFTEDAAPMIQHPLERANQEQYEQSGCLHANMDLYKWAYKLYPFMSGDLLLRCFKLAIECRYLDMQASPYDLSDFNMIPIAVDTPQGKEKYVSEQHRLKKIADPLRLELAAAYDKLIQLCDDVPKT
ncbi:hypothetical protein PQO03_07815 [Lentisphaera profundi]|uniref:3-methyladenine DNA glycosylase n=1 Tax=Lentisphaera profundi TaxID=1658616 RepID=A0ABY7VP94_9BACT|nr:hypothetical protein [Lentisphaera profundi]WDE95626.1 hypothetical protein PQO03_07815 [Lentisphaera profundi]